MHTSGSILFALAGLTLVVTPASLPAQRTAQAVSATAERTNAGPPSLTPAVLMPAAIASFGAAASGGATYVYGGHIGKAHAHSRDNVVGTFWRLADGAFQALPEGPALQGTALAAGPDGRLWRVGGLFARNDSSQDEDLWSTASVACFDPVVGTWSECTPLPEARSSHDAFVVDGWLCVVGGWQLAGDDEGHWHQTAWRADLRQEPLVWLPLPAPDERRRACALAARGSQLVVLGGIGPDGMLSSVEVLDAGANAWRPGPALPGNAFGTAAIGVGDTVFATVRDGRLVAWPGDGDWQVRAQLETPRFFHRIVPAGPDRLLVLGGAGRGDHTNVTELVSLRADAEAPEVREFVLAAPSPITHRQALIVDGDTLWTFGGNRGGADRFAPEQFADDIWRIDLATMATRRVASLPTGRQSLAAATWGHGRDNVLLGGLGVSPDGSVASLAAAFRWHGRLRQLQPLAELPAPRTQCQVVHHAGRLLVLGGTDFVPDDGGGTTEGDARLVFELDLTAQTPRFVESQLRLPRARRSFGAALLGKRLLLLGGLGDGFEPAGPADVHDFETDTWQALELPRQWVSPQLTVLGERVYIACGGTMQGQRFTEDRTLWSWSPQEGFRLVAELPFAVRHMQMFARHNRLWFYAANDARGVVLRAFEPDPSVHVPEAPSHR